MDIFHTAYFQSQMTHELHMVRLKCGYESKHTQAEPAQGATSRQLPKASHQAESRPAGMQQPSLGSLSLLYISHLVLHG